MIDWTTDQGVMELCLAHPPCNEIGSHVMGQLESFLEQVERTRPRALLVHSGLARGFCAGADLRELYAAIRGRKPAEYRAELASFVERVHGVMDRLDGMGVTTVGAISGVCFGGGFELALALDVLVADTSARFCFPELRLGIIPGFGGIPRLSREVPNAVVRDLILTGRSLGARRAGELGLVSQVVARGQALDVARAVARQAALFDPAVVASAKSFMKPIPRAELLEEQRRFLTMFESQRVVDALQRFVESDDAMPYLPAGAAMTVDLSRLHCLGEALRDAVLTWKSNVALLEADRHRETARYDYRELRADAERVASVLQGPGFDAGARCAILMSNQSKWIVSGIGALWAGAVLVPLDYKLSPAEQLQLIAHSRPSALIVEYPAWRLLADEGSARAALAGTRVLVTEAPADAALPGAERWEQPARTAFRFVMRSRQDVACVVYSSGTSGKPKGCLLTHDNYLEQAQCLARMFPMQEDDRYFSVLPTNHAIDFMCGSVIPFLYGAAVVHQRTLRAEFLAPTMKRYGVTHTALVPRILRALRERIEQQLDELPEWQRRAIDALGAANDLATQRAPNHRLSRTLLAPLHARFGGRLRMIFAGGAFVDPELANFFYRLGFPVVIGYGLTEACTVLTVNDLRPFRATTVGKPVAGVEIELRARDEDGVGEVFARGRTIMRGYLDADDLTREALEDGWLRTGDLGTIDAAGHVKLLGRVKNMIVTDGGKNVYSEDVESAFDRVECEELCVLPASQVSERSALGGEQLTLVVRPRKDASQSALAEQLSAVNVGLSHYKRVAAYLLWEPEFPRTASMKIKRGELAQQVRSARTAAVPLRRA